MTREEILFEIEFYKSAIKANGNHVVFLKEKLQDYEKQLVELEVEVYRGWKPRKDDKYWLIDGYGRTTCSTEGVHCFTKEYQDDSLLGIFKTEEQAKQSYDRHMAGEELKKLISEENAKQGWKVDWKDKFQNRYCIVAYSHQNKELSKTRDMEFQSQENELYFSEKSAGNKDFLDKIKPLWLKWKGIE